MDTHRPDICALIPTYNNGKTITDVVLRTLQVMHYVIVVVDGSTDNTLSRLQAVPIPDTHTLDLVVLPRNTGKGGALKAGFDRARALGFTYALTLDGDGQHYPEDIPAMLEGLRLWPGSIIVGARSRGNGLEGQAPRSSFANKFSNFWFTVQTAIHMQDTQSGMRIYPLDKLGHYHCLTSRYEAELELLVFAAWRNVPIHSVPIRVFYPSEQERVSHFRPFMDFTRISILNTVLCLLALVYGYPARYWRSAYCALAFVGAVIVNSIGNLFDPRNFFPRLGRTTRWIMQHLADNRFTITNPEALPDRPVMFIANHCSMYDVVSILSCRPKTVIVAAPWVYKNVLFGRLAQKAGYPKAADGVEAILENLRTKVKEGYSVLVFPEGTRSMDGDVHTFHQGAFYFAEQLQLPIQPVLFRDMYNLLSKADFRIGKADTTMTYLPLLEPGDTRFGDTIRLQAKAMKHHYQQLIRTDIQA